MGKDAEREEESGVIVFYCVLAFAVYFLIGCGIGAWLDDDEKRLFTWVKQCPLGYTAGVLLWPLWVRARRSELQSKPSATSSIDGR
jgi:hypothetical protein